MSVYTSSKKILILTFTSVLMAVKRNFCKCEGCHRIHRIHTPRLPVDFDLWHTKSELVLLSDNLHFTVAGDELNEPLAPWQPWCTDFSQLAKPYKAVLVSFTSGALVGFLNSLTTFTLDLDTGCFPDQRYQSFEIVAYWDGRVPLVHPVGIWQMFPSRHNLNE